MKRQMPDGSYRDVGIEPEPQSAREALFAIAGAARRPNIGAALREIRQLANAGLAARHSADSELTDVLADKLAEAHKVLREMCEGAGWSEELSAEYDKALALPPDLEAMVERRLGPQ